MSDDLDLHDWRRRVAGLYALGSVEAWRAGREELFRTHPQSAARKGGLRWFAHDPRYRVAARLHSIPGAGTLDIDSGGEDGVVRYRRAGRLHFTLPDGPAELTLFRQLGYGGGLFLPFRDTTAPERTYGGGRYLVDGVKMTLGGCLEVTPGSDEVVIDFNYAYNPSCAYDDRWACPLAPPENRLALPVAAGELRYR